MHGADEQIASIDLTVIVATGHADRMGLRGICGINGGRQGIKGAKGRLNSIPTVI
jgi:hypothetical protein